MSSQRAIDPQLHTTLVSIYEEIMWLSARPKVTPSLARAWYTHVMSVPLKRRLCCFTGKVSGSAIADRKGPLRLEHFKRIQTTLTSLVKRHRAEQLNDPDDFVRTVVRCEQVHIVTFDENYAARKAKGSYREAGITLVPWKQIDPTRRTELWQRMLRGKVANADAFKP